MSISVEHGVFYLETAHTLYQMKTDSFGVLRHLWYGAKTGCVMDYLLDYPGVGFSPNIYEAENQRTYSLDTLPLEYAAGDSGDFRIPAFSAICANGSGALSLRFQEYQIKRGKYSIEGLPAVYGEEDEAETLEIILQDNPSGLQVCLLYGVFPQADIITRSVTIRNSGKERIVLQRVHSLCLDIPWGDWEWVHFHGRHTMERQPERVPLIHGVQESNSGRGVSSHQQNPAVLLCEKGCTETNGLCIGAVLMYSGGFQAQVQLDQLNQTRLVMGINPETFCWTLEPGESFHAPEAILSCSENGMGELSRRFHRIIRENVCRGRYKLSERPVLINNWEATYFDFDEEKIERIAEQASRLGIDMMVLDDGWFGKRDSDTSGLGDWVVNENKLHGGLDKLIEKINGMGMKFGIWFEPESISEDSNLYRTHPEWVIRIPGRNPSRSRYQLVLDLSNGDVAEYIYQSVARILRENHIEYVKWDMNRSICDWYSAVLPPERQKEMAHRYVLGLYAVLERLTREFPHILFEGCCGGGGRFDAGMLYYCPQIWCSDNTDAHDRSLIQYGTSFFYPISAVGSHVSAVPNHQTGRVTSLKTRAAAAMAGSFGYELDLNQLSEPEKQEVAQQVKAYKGYQKLIHGGRYYRLSNPFEDSMAVWAFVSENQSEVLVQGMVFQAVSNALRRRIRLAGLDGNGFYRNTKDGRVYTGRALMAGGFLLPWMSGDDASFEIHLERVVPPSC